MSDEKKPPLRPEVVDADEENERSEEPPRSGGIRRIERTTLPAPTGLVDALGRLFQSPRREARKAREWADAARAHSELDGALTDLGRSRERLRGLPTILAADEEERQAELARQRNLRAQEERIGRTQALQDQLAEEELLAQIAEARRRRLRADDGSGGREPRSAAVRALRARIRTREELLGERDRLVAQIKARAGGQALNEDDAREIQNIEDDVQRLLDDLE